MNSAQGAEIGDETMSEHELPNLERDRRFPSGAWTGYFLQYWLPGRHTTNVDLTCSNGELTGTGRDFVGPYTIDGSYDIATGRCEWTKQYLGKHAVAYRGVNDGHGIWGVWEIRQLAGLFVDRGGFHVWPEGTDVSQESDKTEQAVLAAMREEFGSQLFRACRGLVILGVAIALAVLLWWGLRY
jgi:hypothetical protein